MPRESLTVVFFVVFGFPVTACYSGDRRIARCALQREPITLEAPRKQSSI